MVMMFVVVLGLCFSPSSIVAFEFHSFVYGKRGNSHARQAEMVRAVVMSRARLGIRLDCQLEFFCFCFHSRIEGSPLRAADFNFLRFTEWSKRVVVQIE